MKALNPDTSEPHAYLAVLEAPREVADLDVADGDLLLEALLLVVALLDHRLHLALELVALLRHDQLPPQRSVQLLQQVRLLVAQPPVLGLARTDACQRSDEKRRERKQHGEGPGTCGQERRLHV